MRAKRTHERLSIRVNGYIEPVCIRGATSDAWVLNQILICEEYGGFVTSKPKRILDAGANIGMASVYFKKCFPDAQIVAIEPDPDSFDLLTTNTQHLSDVHRICGGIWSSDTRLSVRYPKAEKYAIEVVEDRENGSIDALSVDTIMTRFGWDHIDVVKMDIEGSEATVLSNPSAAWLDKIDTLIIEIHQDMAPGVARILFSAFAERDFRFRWRGENLILSRIGVPASNV